MTSRRACEGHHGRWTQEGPTLDKLGRGWLASSNELAAWPRARKRTGLLGATLHRRVVRGILPNLATVYGGAGRADRRRRHAASTGRRVPVLRALADRATGAHDRQPPA